VRNGTSYAPRTGSKLVQRHDRKPARQVSLVGTKVAHRRKGSRNMDRAEFVEMVEREGTFAPGEAEAAIEATLSALGAALVASERRNLSAGLPEEFRRPLLGAARELGFDLERFYERVQKHEGVRPGRAREHAQIVCRALAGSLQPEALELLKRHAPWLAPLLQGAELYPAAPAPEVIHRQVPTNTLAAGRPGSKRPLSG